MQYAAFPAELPATVLVLSGQKARLPGWAGGLALRAGAAILVAAAGCRYAAAANRGNAAVVALIQFPAAHTTPC